MYYFLRQSVHTITTATAADLPAKQVFVDEQAMQATSNEVLLQTVNPGKLAKYK